MKDILSYGLAGKKYLQEQEVKWKKHLNILSQMKKMQKKQFFKK
jgi:hypothetical protein